MCIVCVLWEKGKLTSKEADNALIELLENTQSDRELMHAQEAIEKIKQESIDKK